MFLPFTKMVLVIPERMMSRRHPVFGISKILFFSSSFVNFVLYIIHGRYVASIFDLQTI